MILDLLKVAGLAKRSHGADYGVDKAQKEKAQVVADLEFSARLFEGWVQIDPLAEGGEAGVKSLD